MAQEEEKPPLDGQIAPETANPEVRATIEATKKVIEQSAAEIERAKRLLRETEELSSSSADRARTEGRSSSTP
jgi:hypothetical protein